MLKKFVSSLLAIVFLAGCNGGTAAPAATADDAGKMADTLVEELGLGDRVAEVKERVLYGMFFQMDKETVTGGKAYLAEDKSSDTVGVFTVTDADKAIEYINDYLVTQKENSEMYNPEEVFKISNAIVEKNSDGTIVVLVICDDIETAKTKVAELLGN